MLSSNCKLHHGGHDIQLDYNMHKVKQIRDVGKSAKSNILILADNIMPIHCIYINNPNNNWYRT